MHCSVGEPSNCVVVELSTRFSVTMVNYFLIMVKQVAACLLRVLSSHSLFSGSAIIYRRIHTTNFISVNHGDQLTTSRDSRIPYLQRAL